jgi:hypothetical protein
MSRGGHLEKYSSVSIVFANRNKEGAAGTRVVFIRNGRVVSINDLKRG